MHFHQWKRREVLALLTGRVLAWPAAVRAQQPGRHTIGFLPPTLLTRTDEMIE